jgi:hypothetical protein
MVEAANHLPVNRHAEPYLGSIEAPTENAMQQ